MTKKDYKITEKAGPFVAGRPSPGAGETISLTADQAFYPLQLGEITASDDAAQAAGDQSETPAEPAVAETDEQAKSRTKKA